MIDVTEYLFSGAHTLDALRMQASIVQNVNGKMTVILLA